MILTHPNTAYKIRSLLLAIVYLSGCEGIMALRQIMMILFGWSCETIGLPPLVNIHSKLLTFIDYVYRRASLQPYRSRVGA